MEFQEALKSRPGLNLQDLTFDDIALYVNENLAENEEMLAFRDREPVKRYTLSRKLSRKLMVCSYG